MEHDRIIVGDAQAEIAKVLSGESDGCIITGDCLEIMPDMPDGCVDAVVTDPPYGVNLGEHGAAKENRPQWLAKQGYATYADTRENFLSIVVPGVVLAIEKSHRGLVFVADTNGWDLPRPDAVGGVYLPAGCGRCAWGFQTLAHFLLYGSCPNLNLGAKPVSFTSTARAEKNGHPCPKPVAWMEWCCKLATSVGDIIIDPFCGSGTTCVAAKKLGRRWIGIEIDEKYADIARRRVASTPKPLFVEEPKPPDAAPLFAETD